MVLYCRVSLNAFVESFRNTSGPDSFFTLPAKGLMHIVPQEEIEYGLSLLRESIGLYEERKGIPVEKSKKAMPFFRQDSRRLVGAQLGPVSFKHLTLPTGGLVWISVGAGSFKKKIRRSTHHWRDKRER